MGEKTSIEAKKVLTPEFRVSYPAVFKPKAFEGQEAKYSVVMLFDKKTDITTLKKAAHAAKIEKWGPNKEKWPKNLRSPFRDGADREGTDGYGEGVIFISASSKTPVGLVDNKLGAILNEQDFYAGCYARAQIVAYAYDTHGNRGVAFGLQNLQKLRDGKSFSGKQKAEDVFDAVEDGSDDEGNYEDDSGDEAPAGF